jgi:putative addiction module component (TIGR02574 family)
MVPAMTRSELVDEIRKLDADERALLMEELHQIVEEDFPLTEEQWQEIERRMEEHERDPSTAIPWEEVRDRLLAKFG